MESRQSKVFAEIDHLLGCIHKNPSESLRQKIESYSKKVFSQVTGRQSNESTADLKEKITIRVTNTLDQRSVLQCQDIMQKLLNSNALNNKPEVLKMLLKLSEFSNSNEESLSNVFREIKKRQLNATVQTNASLLMQSIPQSKRMVQMTEQLKMVRNRGSVEQGISENDLVRQLSFVFTNTSSNEIIEVNDGYQLKNSINVSQTVKRMISQMADLGWLHKKIVKSSDRQGNIRKALKLAIQQELNQYYRWIGTMQNLIKDNKLTLRKLYLWSFYPQQILKWLAIILDAVEPFDGCHIISIVNSYRPNGLVAVHELISRILSSLLQPLLNYIYNWVYMGELLDGRSEFFISQNKKVVESQEWTGRFKLVSENVPNILNSQSAKMIFNSGKAIYFLRNKCKVIYHVKTAFIDVKNIHEISNEGSNTLVSPIFMNWLNAVHEEVNKVLVDVMFNQFHLKYHLESMKHFYLAGKGDFIQNLYDNLKQKLSHKKHQISEHSLDGYISDAVAKCFTDFKMPDKVSSYRGSVIDRLIAKKIQFSNNVVQGWDCFNFHYELEKLQPLQTILSPEIMLNYQKVFHFLWKVKQIQETLKNLWIYQSRQQSLKMRRTKSRELQALFHLSYLIRNSMTHFTTNLYSYLMVTIESSWRKFWQQIDQAKGFDDILKQHKQFQQQILQITLNTLKGRNIQASLNNIFIVINNFKNMYLRLQENFDDYYQKLRLYEQRQSMAHRGIIMVESLQIPEFNSGKLFKDIRDVKACFDTTFKNLFIQIRKESESKLNILSFKLDFSQYYSNLYIE